MKFTKKKAVELYAILTGHNKSFLAKNLEYKPDEMHCFDLNVGLVNYSAWKQDGRILVHVGLGAHIRDSYWFDLETLERDDEKQEKCDDQIRADIREQY
jgi:hypothetical protein